MKLYNTLTRKVEDFTPLDGKTVRMYSCGPTVYDHAHIGNLSAYIFADTLHRMLQVSGLAVEHAMNYTDVDDKTIRRSRDTYPNEDSRAALDKLTSDYIAIFNEDIQKIGNNVSALTLIRATEKIDGMKALVTRLFERGFAYIAEDGVYFSIENYRRSGKVYGQLLEITASNTSEARIQNDEYDKDSVHDFALWKTQKEGEPRWEFTLDGRDLAGRPGWHIECSVMSRGALGQPFDIHTGGVDLIFPHHENEIAQSTAGEDNPLMAKFFVHNGHILVDNKKMAKSASNFYTLEDVVQKGHYPLAFRLLVLQAHYRSQAHFSWDNLAAAQNRLQNFYNMATLRWQSVAIDRDNSPFFEEQTAHIKASIQEDLNTPAILAQVSALQNKLETELVSASEREAFEHLLGVLDELLGLKFMEQPDISSKQKTLIAERQAAREQKDWTRSDELRNKLKEQGIGVRDTDHGPIWYRI